MADPHFAASEQWEEIAIQVAVAPRHVPHWTYGFGSDEERLFVEQVLPAICPDSLLGWLQRQVSLDALIGADESRPSNRRVDFLIAHPSGAQLVVEIDGAQHADQLTADANRDADLHAAGYEVFRIPVQEVRSGAGVELDRLRHRLQHIPLDASQPPHGRLFTLIRRAHQLQLALWYAVATGMRPANGDSPISVIVDLGDDFDEATAQRFADAVLRDLNALIADVASLYEDVGCRFTVAADSVGSVFVRFTADYSAPTPNTLYVRDIYLPFPIGIESPASVTTADITASERVCERLLERIFGYDTFREGQFAAIERCLRGKDAIVLLPTGAGKSIAFQLSAILRPGICIVVAPLISLIDDQIENLRTFGIDRACQITSASNWEEQRLILAQLGRGEYLFCYVAPERFQNQRFRDALRLLTTHTAVSLVAIDEAHCISEWGHDFRPAYLNLARISREYCAFNGVSPPLMALTGTASRAVLKDMQRELQIEDFEAIITPSSFDRPEIHFEVLSCRSNEKLSRLQGVLEVLPRKFGRTASDFFGCSGEHTASGLIFCPHVRGDFGILRVSQELANRMRQQVLLYGSRPPIGVPEDTWQTQRANMARQFKRNHAAVMACTSSFGMGIDKPNIRYTVHFGVPKSIEAFYQEAGRAGRDRNDAYCIILYSNDAPVRTQQLLSPAASIEALQEHLKSVPRRDGDDITRSLWFHTNAFSGIEADHNAVCRLIDEIGSLENPRNVVVEFSGSDRDARERAVYRLLTIGVVSDYTVDHASRTFQVRLSGASNHDILESIYQYVATYQRQQAQVIADRLREQMSLAGQEFARISARQLIEFVYEVIESSRRQALSEMVALCEIGANEAAFRERLLAYLGTSSFSGAIDRILESDGAGLAEAIQVLREVRSPFDAVQLRGESGRALEAYPNHAGLRLVRGAAEALTASPDRIAVSENTEASVRFAIERHGMGQHAVLTDIVAAALLVSEVETELAQLIITGAMRGAKDQRVAARQLAQELPRPLSDCALATLLDKLNRQVLKLLEGRE